MPLGGGRGKDGGRRGKSSQLRLVRWLEISQEDTRQPSEEVPSSQREQHLRRLSGCWLLSPEGGVQMQPVLSNALHATGRRGVGARRCRGRSGEHPAELREQRIEMGGGQKWGRSSHRGRSTSSWLRSSFLMIMPYFFSLKTASSIRCAFTYH